MTQNVSAKDLQLIKDKINQLQRMITMAVEQLTHAIESLCNNHHKPTSNAMDTDGLDTLNGPTNMNPTTLNLLALITELKNDILTFTCETHAMVQPKLPPLTKPKSPCSSAT